MDKADGRRQVPNGSERRWPSAFEQKVVVVSACSEGGVIGVGIALFGGVLNRYFGVHTGVQFMTCYASGWIVAKVFGI